MGAGVSRYLIGGCWLQGVAVGGVGEPGFHLGPTWRGHLLTATEQSQQRTQSQAAPQGGNAPDPLPGCARSGEDSQKKGPKPKAGEQAKLGHSREGPAEGKPASRAEEGAGPGPPAQLCCTCQAIRSLRRVSLSWSSGCSRVYSSVKKAWGDRQDIGGFLCLW